MIRNFETDDLLKINLSEQARKELAPNALRLILQMAMSGTVSTIVHEDTILMICGLVVNQGRGEMWSYPAQEIESHKVSFYRDSKAIIEAWKLENKLSELVCYVHTSNSKSENWLKRLGFKNGVSVIINSVEYHVLRWVK